MKKKAVILFFPLFESENISSNFPWALLYLERMVRYLDIDVILIDERLQKDYEEVIRQNSDRILLVGISAMIGFQVVGGMNFFEILKKYSDAPVVWGGWFPTHFEEMILNDGYADFVCVGQGEVPFQTLTERLLKGEGTDDIPGICFMKNGQVLKNPNEELKNPEAFPPPDLSLIDINKLIDLNGKVEKGFRGADCLATTGCPNKCTFCSLAVVYGRKWYAKKVPEIISDIKYFIEKASISHITFCDDNFFVSKNFVMEFCAALEQSGISITWEANSNVSYILKGFSDSDLRIIYRAGCRRIKIGAESGDQQVLDVINKKIKVKDSYTVIRMLKRNNIRTRIFTMLCFPMNPDRDFWLTMNFIGRAKLIDRNIDSNINFYKPYPKTEMYPLCAEKGFSYPGNTKGLLEMLSRQFITPWYKSDYYRHLDDFLNFYYLFASPVFFMSFPLLYRPLVFVLNMILFPAIFIRFKLNLMRFPFEARLFKRIIRLRKDVKYLETVSNFKTR
jgi:anaerobic magnesium-protoporphyrin IX monomethyl ester cyclase